jgi:hypothetical protein
MKGIKARYFIRHAKFLFLHFSMWDDSHVAQERGANLKHWEEGKPGDPST